MINTYTSDSISKAFQNKLHSSASKLQNIKNQIHINTRQRGAYKQMYFLFTGRWAYNRGGGLISGESYLISGGGGGLVTGCIFLFTGRWAYS